MESSSWLINSSEWPNQPVIEPSVGSQKEAKLEKQFVVNTNEFANTFDNLLEKYELDKELRVSTWVNRFIKNCNHSKQWGPLTMSEIEKQKILHQRWTEEIGEQWNILTQVLTWFKIQREYMNAEAEFREVIQSIYRRSHCYQKTLFRLHIRKPFTGESRSRWQL